MRRSTPCSASFFSLVIALCLLPQPTLPAARAAQQHPAAEPQAPPKSVSLPGLGDRVMVRRDGRGIPYIEAGNDADLYRAQGYVTANDRLWQMDLMRRTARGELSEIFGQATLEQDKLHRKFGFGALATETLAGLSPSVRSQLESYAGGVNAFIESCDETTLPPEFKVLKYKPRPWLPEDSLVIGKLFFETLTTSWRVDLMRASLADLPEPMRAELLTETSPLDVVIVGTDSRRPEKRASSAPARNLPRQSLDAGVAEEAERMTQAMRDALSRLGLYVEDHAASNNWVVSAKHSASGKAMLANDPHLPPSAPSIWYMTHLSTPALRVAGVTPPGLPGIIIGHNDRIAWGLTNLGADVQDLYDEKFDAAKPLLYATPSGLREAVVRHEQIRVRKSFASQETNDLAFDVKVTRHGPIIMERQTSAYALRWTALDTDASELEAFYRINRAGNWKGFCDGLSRYKGPAQNIVYADVDGHIGYYGIGQIPIRKEGDGSLPYDGTTDNGGWMGYIAFESLPHLYDPPSGIIVTANNRIVGTSYPHHLTHDWAEPYRARRIYDLLAAKERLTPEDFRLIQADTYSTAGANLANAIIKAARSHGDAPAWRQMLDVFEKWDAKAAPESRAMPLAITMRRALRRRILEAALGPERARDYNWANGETFLDGLLQTRAPAWLPKEFDSFDALLLAGYQDAREELKRRLGEDESQWTWGRLAQVRFAHPLAGLPFADARFAIAPFPQNGGSGAVNVGAFVSMRMVADTSDWDLTRQGITLGESGDPSSPFWKDQLDAWRDVSPAAFVFTRAKVSSSTRPVLILAPGSTQRRMRSH
jgi:penicillin G amidase